MKSKKLREDEMKEIKESIEYLRYIAQEIWDETAELETLVKGGYAVNETLDERF